MMTQSKELSMYIKRLYASSSMSSFAAVLLVISSLGCSRSIDRLDSEICYQTELSPQPRWVSSGIWTKDSTSFLTVENLFNNILQYSKYKAGTLDAHDLKAVSVGQPTRLRADAKGYIAATLEGDLIWFDEEWNKLQSLSVIDLENSKLGIIKSFYDWIQFGDSVLLLGDLQQHDTQWKTGFIVIPLGEPESFSLVTEVPQQESIGKFYQLGYSYIAALGEKAYYLLLGSKTYMMEISFTKGNLESRQLPDFLMSFPDLQKLPKSQGARTAKEIFGALEKIDAPVSLHAFENMLYLLTRKASNEESIWDAVIVESETGAIGSSIRLPTRANHLVVIPGKQHWALLEKGPVEKIGHQKVPSAKLVPRTWIEAKLEMTPSLCK